MGDNDGCSGNAFVIIWRIGDEDSILASTMGPSLTQKGLGAPSFRGSTNDLNALGAGGLNGSLVRGRETVGRNSPSVDSIQGTLCRHALRFCLKGVFHRFT
jgi:hypothetical protein